MVRSSQRSRSRKDPQVPLRRRLKELAATLGASDDCPGPRGGRIGAASELETARHFRLDWKSVAAIVRPMVEYGLARHRRQPLHVLGIDEMSRRKRHHYLTVVYDLERGVLLWVGEDRTGEALVRFFTPLGRRRSATIQVVCLDMWKPHLKAVREHARKVCVFSTSETHLGFFQATVQSPVHPELDRAPGPDCTGAGDPGFPVFAPSSV